MLASRSLACAFGLVLWTKAVLARGRLLEIGYYDDASRRGATTEGGIQTLSEFDYERRETGASANNRLIGVFLIGVLFVVNGFVCLEVPGEQSYAPVVQYHKC